MKNYLSICFLSVALLATIVTKAQIPILSSNPTANAVIFLDFDGHTVDGTGWNIGGPLYLGNSGMTTSNIVDVFNRVAEDYRPFNVNVTTDSTKFLAAPLFSRMRVILTTSYEWFGASGGVAFVGSFIWGDDTPCFVFTSLLGNSKNISEAASHEAGHTLGLYHQSKYDPVTCAKTSEYHAGAGIGEIGWAPIMGVGYYQNLTLWNNGPNSYGCTNYQSDLSVITTGNGFSYRTDDHSNSFATATLATYSSSQFTVNGIIEQNTDKDLIKFVHPLLGRFQLSAVPYNVGTGNSGSNLDLQVSLYNSSETLVATYNPGTLLNSVIDTTLTPGTYYLRIEGKGNMYAPNYASLGSYSLQASFSAGNPLPLRRLELSGTLVNDKHKLSWIIDADEEVVEQVLEVSTDGRNFSPVTTSAASDRQFLYKPYVSTLAQYRLSVTFDNGKHYYSNVISLRGNGSIVKPRLVTNLINNNMITVNSPGNYRYVIIDMSSRVIAKGQLTIGLNNINPSLLTGGMHIIQYTNGEEQWTEKFIRQ